MSYVLFAKSSSPRLIDTAYLTYWKPLIKMATSMGGGGEDSLDELSYILVRMPKNPSFNSIILSVSKLRKSTFMEL